MTKDELERISRWVEQLVDAPMSEIAESTKGGPEGFYLFFGDNSKGQVIGALLRNEFRNEVTD